MGVWGKHLSKIFAFENAFVKDHCQKTFVTPPAPCGWPAVCNAGRPAPFGQKHTYLHVAQMERLVAVGHNVLRKKLFLFMHVCSNDLLYMHACERLCNQSMHACMQELGGGPV